MAVENKAGEMIEGLEQLDEKEVSAEPEDIEDFHASSGDESMEETLGTLKEDAPAGGASPLDEEETEDSGEAEEVEEEVAEENEEPAEAHVAEDRPEASKGGELTMSLTGNMTLRLQYKYEGQDVVIGFKDHSLQVRLSDGTEFKIPIRRPGLKLVS